MSTPVAEAGEAASPRRPLSGAPGRAGRARRAYRRSARHAPPGFVPLATLAVAFLTLPLLGLILRSPWRQLPADLAHRVR